MHAMAGELDMRKMSGLKRVLPKTRWLMLIGCLALAGCSRSQRVLLQGRNHRRGVDAQQRFSAIVLLFAAFLTAYYTFRLYFRVFEGPEVIPPAAGRHGHGTHDVDEHSPMRIDDAIMPMHGHDDHEPSQPRAGAHDRAAGGAGDRRDLRGLLQFPRARHSLGGFLGQSPSFALAYDMASADGSDQAARRCRYGQFERTSRRAADRESSRSRQPTHCADDRQRRRSRSLGICLAYLLHLKDRAAGRRLAEQIRRRSSAARTQILGRRDLPGRDRRAAAVARASLLRDRSHHRRRHRLADRLHPAAVRLRAEAHDPARLSAGIRRRRCSWASR